jgi:hypothetical protein
VKIFPEDTGQGNEESQCWEPKAAFREIAGRFAGD